MKTNKLYFIMLATATVVFSSCLKDSLYDDGSLQANKSNGNDKFVEVHLTTADNNNTKTYSFDNSSRDTTVNTFVPVRLTSTDVASEDVKVTFKQLTSADLSTDGTLKSMVNDNGYVIPTANYSVLNDNNTVVIPKGQREGYIRVKISPSKFVGLNSVLAFQLTSVNGGGYALSNLNMGYAIFNVKNQYDKDYICVGTFHHPSSGDRAISETKHLSTVDVKTCKISVGDLGDKYTVNITVDPVTNDVTFSGGSPYVIFASLTRSYYEPSTGKFYLHYYYVGGNGNRVMDEVYTPK